MAMNTNTSFNVANVPDAELIRQGSPDLYQLTPKKDKIGTISRRTLGEKDPKKPNKTILLVGETGAGKSTLIDALINHAMGVNWEDDVWFHMVQDEEKSQTESQTSDVVVYEICGFEGKTLPYSLTIIDTPGYGNTEDIQLDVIINQRLLDLFRAEEGVHEVNAVGLVMKSTDNRLSPRLRYVFDAVVSLFGKDMEKNIVALITHSTGKTPANVLSALKAANIKFAKNAENKPVYFLFDNCQHEERQKDDAVPTVTPKGMKQFNEFLEKNKPQKLEETVDVLNERVRLTACIRNLQERVQLIALKQKEIQQTQDALETYEEEMKKDENFTVEVDEPYKELERIEGGIWGLVFYQAAVFCTKCEENCHYPGCTMAWDASWCEVMKDGRCTACTGKCPVSDHIKEKWRFVTKTHKVRKTLQDVKDKYEENKAERGNLLESLQKEMEKLEANKTQWLDEAYQHVMNLETMALNVVSVSTYVHLDFLIEEMEKKKDTVKVQTLKEMSSRADKGLLAAMKYCYHKTTSIFKTSEGDTAV